MFKKSTFPPKDETNKIIDSELSTNPIHSLNHFFETDDDSKDAKSLSESNENENETSSDDEMIDPRCDNDKKEDDKSTNKHFYTTEKKIKSNEEIDQKSEDLTKKKIKQPSSQNQTFSNSNCSFFPDPEAPKKKQKIESSQNPFPPKNY